MLIRGGPTFGKCAKNSSIIQLSSLIWSWVWRVLIALFCLPCLKQTAGCYSRLFYSFCVRGWLAKELKNIHMVDYMEFKDDIRFVYLDELDIGPKVEDMITFLSSSPELAKRE